MFDKDLDATARTGIRCVTAAFVTFVVTIGGCNMHEDAMIARMVESGADPIAAGCAYSTERSLCTAVAVGRVEQ